MSASITSGAFVPAVPDAEASTRWRGDEPGFEVTLEIEGRRFVRRGKCEVRLGFCPNSPSAAELGDHAYLAYLTVDAFDAEASPAVERLSAPINRPWGMRELDLRTLDGHRPMVAQAIG